MLYYDNMSDTPFPESYWAGVKVQTCRSRRVTYKVIHELLPDLRQVLLNNLLALQIMKKMKLTSKANFWDLAVNVTTNTTG